MKAKRINMDRVEREMAQTARIVNDLVRQPIRLPGMRREINRNIARVSKTLAEIDRKLKRLRRRHGPTRTLQRLAELRANPKLKGRSRSEHEHRTSH